MWQAPESRGFWPLLSHVLLGCLALLQCRVFPARHRAALHAVLHLGAWVPKKEKRIARSARIALEEWSAEMVVLEVRFCVGACGP